MEVYKHPKTVLKSDAVACIRDHAFETDQNRILSKPVLDLLYDLDALRIMIPASCGGGEWDLPEIVRFFEALAWADGNTGWLVNLGAGANMFAGYFEESVSKKIFQNPKVWCAGSGATTGKAVKTAGGYLVSGGWKYASGSTHATHFTANAILNDKDSKPLLEDDGMPVFRSFIFDRKDVQVYDTWHTTGLCATGSNDFSVNNLFVPDAHVFSLTQPSAFADGPLYRFPFEVLAVVNMACMPVGMGMHFIDLFYELIAYKKPLHGNTLLKEKDSVKRTIETVIPPFLEARSRMYDALESCWNFYKEGTTADAGQLNEVCRSSRKAASLARKMVFELYPFCGMNMVFSTSGLNKVWRDMSVASQHYLLSPLV